MDPQFRELLVSFRKIQRMLSRPYNPSPDSQEQFHAWIHQSGRLEGVSALFSFFNIEESND